MNPHAHRTAALSLFALGALVLQVPLHAQIVADPGAPGNQRPTILQTANGVPQVNIQTPSPAGVSRNTYSQFDVDGRGAILNNSRTNVQTQLGGMVAANPWISTPARVILNEVNSSNPSYLKGYVEVAGQRAEVIIANPAGIQVSGGGFINASGVTLTTGTPVMNSGNLESFRVQRGQVTIDGTGLDTSTADYTRILARAMQVNAGLWAKDLTLVTGTNEVKALASGTAATTTPIAGIGSAPSYMLDVAALGGMYAGKIFLVGTEAGLGVNNRGTLAAHEGDLVLQSNGYLTNTGAIQAASSSGTAGNVSITTAGDVTNSGSAAVIGAQGHVQVDTAGGLTNDNGAVLAAAGTLNVEAAGIVQNSQATIAANSDVSLSAAGLNNESGTVASVHRALAINTSGATRNTVAAGASKGGLLSAAGSVSLNNAGLTNSGSVIVGTDVVINTHANTLDNTRGTLVSRGALQIESGDLINEAGYIAAVGQLNATAGQVTNTNGGLIVGESSVRFDATGFDNRGGQVQSLGDTTIDVGAGIVDNTTSLIRGGGTVTLNAAAVINSNTLGPDQGIEGDNVVVTTATLANDGGAIRADNNVTLTSSGEINNTAGLVSAVNTATIQDVGSTKTLSITNTGGTAIAGTLLNVNAASLSGDGKLLSQQDLGVTLTSDFSNTGDVIANRDASFATTGKLTNKSRLLAGRNLAASGQDVENTVSGEISSASTTVSAAGALTNRGLVDGVETRVNASTVTNIGTGRIYGDHVAIAAATLNNDTETVNAVRADAVIAARQRLDIGVATLNNRERALIFSAGTGNEALNIGGALDANGHATGQAATVNNNSAIIESLGGLNINAARLNNTNEHFSTRIDVVVGPEARKYLQPEGSASKIGIENFVYEGWSRAGQYRYNTSPPVNNTGVLGQSPVPRVGEQDCTGDEPNEVCTRVTGADYLSGNPAWGYFGIAAPAAAPTPPALATPVAPAAAAAATCTAGAGYDASACAAYNAALAQYNSDLTAYNNAWASYTTAQAAWQADTDAKYTQLDARIESYNAGFTGALVRTWTEYLVTHTESETKVASSDPGQIISGGNMHLAGGDLVNDKSRIIAGGTLTGDLANLHNIEAEGVHVVHETGTSEYTRPNWKGGFKKYYARQWDGQIAYAPADVVTTITLPVTEQLDHTAPAGTQTQVGTRATSGTTQTAAGATVGQRVVTTSGPVSLPGNSLFRQNPDPAASYLIETDPRFTDRRQWLGSDYMLKAMSFDPALVQKRLGDGFYEQKLIRDQVAQLTGRRFLDGYANDEAQYQALMNAGITYAKEWNLVPGVALTALQMAQLTSDIVWLVAQEVTLADGSRQTVLVPQVYVHVKPGDLKPDGTLLAGDSIQLNLSGNLVNAGTIAGRRVVNLTADNIQNLGGRISADTVVARANIDLNNIGGQIAAKDALVATAGRDINVVTTTQSGANTAGLSDFSRTGIDRVAGLYVTGADGTLIASAGRDANIIAGVIANTGDNSATYLIAGNNLNLGTVTTSVQENNVRDNANYLRGGNTQEVGSQIVGNGSVRLAAGNDLNARAASVNAADALIATAGGNVNIAAGEQSSNQSEGRTREGGSALSKSSTTIRTSQSQTQAVGSSFGGDTVTVVAGQDINVKGSAVISDSGTVLAAGQNVTVEAAQNTWSAGSFREDTKSGLISNGGLSATVGKQQQSTDTVSQGTTAAASTVGAISGDVTIVAGQSYAQTGSDVLAPGGDIAIQAQDVKITEARETSTTTTEQKFKQSGITLAISNPVINAVQTASAMAQAASNTDSSRMKGLAAANTAFAANNAYGAVKSGQGVDALGKSGQIVTERDASGKPTDFHQGRCFGRGHFLRYVGVLGLRVF